MKQLITVILIYLIVVSPFSMVTAATYYVDNGGSNLGNGLSIGSAFQNVVFAVNTAPSGSTIILTGGQTFTEDLVEITNKNHILITSLGPNRAIIRNATTGTNMLGIVNYEMNLALGVSPGRDPLLVVNSSSITISNLCFYGTGADNEANWACVDIVSDGGYCTNITVVQCDMTNANMGVNIFATGNAPDNMFGGLTVVRNTVHEIGFDGIFEWSYYDDQIGAIYCKNVTTANNQVYNIYGRPDLNSGSGIVFFNVSQWECYSNYVHDCGQWEGLGGAGGAGGIFCVFYSDHAHIWGNVVAFVYAKPVGDGVGIDLDRGSIWCIVEANFVHDCGGAGYYSYQAYGNNTWRWDVGINDGSGLSNSNYPAAGKVFEMWFTDYQYMQTNSFEHIYNCTIIGNYSAFEVTDDENIPNTALILNCIFGQMTLRDQNNNPIPLITEDHPINSDPPLGTDWYFAGCDYMTPNFDVSWPSGVAGSSGLDQFQSVIGQEIGTGFTNSPAFVVGTGSVLTNYVLQAGSILRGAGIDVRIYGLSPGTIDAMGTKIRTSGNNPGGLNR